MVASLTRVEDAETVAAADQHGHDGSTRIIRDNPPHPRKSAVPSIPISHAPISDRDYRSVPCPPFDCREAFWSRSDCRYAWTFFSCCAEVAENLCEPSFFWASTTKYK